MGYLAASALAANHAFPITTELLPSFTGAGISSNPFLNDLMGLLAIFRGRQFSPSTPQKAWIFCGNQQCCRLRQGFFLTAQILF